MLCCLGCLCCVEILVVLLVLFGEKLAKDPQWEVKNIRIHQLKVHGLLDGLTAADTSNCPADDKCGVAHAKGCSTCPNSKDVNHGCICGQPPGTVIPANTTGCPWIDPCGVSLHRGCSTCPGDQWENDGCTCRIRTSIKDSGDRFRNFLELITGRVKKPLTFVVTAEVWVRNPNPIGANTVPSDIDITYDGQKLGHAEEPEPHRREHSAQRHRHHIRRAEAR